MEGWREGVREGVGEGGSGMEGGKEGGRRKERRGREGEREARRGSGEWSTFLLARGRRDVVAKHSLRCLLFLLLSTILCTLINNGT